MSKNLLYYGDNLDVLRRHIADESVDLIYLDPPFNSNQDYNVLFREHHGERAAAQIKAFEDTWRWDLGAEAAYQEVVEAGGRGSQAMQAFRTFLGESDMMAYLAMMAPRLIELRRVLKPTGSIYLHCERYRLPADDRVERDPEARAPGQGGRRKAGRTGAVSEYRLRARAPACRPPAALPDQDGVEGAITELISKHLGIS